MAALTSFREPSMCGRHFDVLCSPCLLLFFFFPMAGFADFGMQQAASANTMAKGAGSEGGACEPFDV